MPLNYQVNNLRPFAHSVYFDTSKDTLRFGSFRDLTGISETNTRNEECLRRPANACTYSDSSTLPAEPPWAYTETKTEAEASSRIQLLISAERVYTSSPPSHGRGSPSRFHGPHPLRSTETESTAGHGFPVWVSGAPKHHVRTSDWLSFVAIGEAAGPPMLCCA